MRKSTIFISAVLTTFALVMLYRVASAYRDTAVQVEATSQPTATLAPTATDIPEEPTPTESILTPGEAGQIAAQVVGKTNLLSAESSAFNGVNAYLVTFTNNDVVYVGLDGQVLSVQLAPVVVNVEVPAQKKHKKNNNNNGGGGGESEDHQEHEKQEEHED